MAEKRLSDRNVRMLLENEENSNASDSSLVDDTDSDPNYEPDTDTSRDQPHSSIIGHCRKRLCFEDNLEVPNKKKIETEQTHHEKPSDGSKLVVLQTNLEKLKRQRLLDQKLGRQSAARRKSKKIKAYIEAINNIERGVFVDINKLPQPTPLKASDQQSSSSLDPIQDKRLDKTQDATTDICEDIMEDTSTGQSNVVKNKQPCERNLQKPGRKENFCILCKKTIKEFCKHFENVHKNTEEGIELRKLNKTEDRALKKKLKTKITDVLRKKGNAYLSKLRAKDSFLSGRDAEVIPVKRGINQSSHMDTVQCAHCEGYYKRRKFSQHLQRCQIFMKDQKINPTTTQGQVNALIEHSLPVIEDVEGASKQLMSEVISTMKPRETLNVALRDKLLMQYASEFHKSRRAAFQRNYVSRIITDLARLLMRIREVKGDEIRSLEDVFNPAHFSTLVHIILQEGGYDPESGLVKTCGISNRLRSHIKGAAQTAKKEAAIEEYSQQTTASTTKRKMIKHFLLTLDEKWANEVGRIFDDAVKRSRSESDKKIASEEDIIKTCQYICSKYRPEIIKLEEAESGSMEKQKSYNVLLDYLITHIMCLIRRRPVDFKRGQNKHFEKIDEQENLINEIKNSKYMDMSDEDLKVCSQFQIFYVPGKGWKELVPIALTKIMREAMDALQKNKEHVGVHSDMLFVRARGLPVNPRESMKKVTKSLKLKKPLDLSGNGLRHHAGTFSKLHSSHPQYQDYLASALGHTLHIHKLHYEMPTSILQKLIVMPVLHNLTKPPEEREHQLLEKENPNQTKEELSNKINPKEACQVANQNYSPQRYSPDLPRPPGSSPSKRLSVQRKRWSDEEKKIIYEQFGEQILKGQVVPRSSVVKLFDTNKAKFASRSVDSLVTFVNNKVLRKQKNVTPEVKKFVKSTHRKMTNVPI